MKIKFSQFFKKLRKKGCIFSDFRYNEFVWQTCLADMAQLVEQRIRNAWVRGSSPLIGLHDSLFLE